jgi:hypothetical protein
MIIDAIIVGAILVGCVLISVAGLRKFQPGIEKELQKTQELDSIRTKPKK